MVLSLAFGAGAVAVGLYNWVSNLYTYNRDAWMTDIQVEQNHCYQTENLKVQMFSMDREEVRDVMQADINKINNMILVVTLILALAGEMLFEGQVPPSCPAFVLNAYMICLCSGTFHLVLSILFGVFASHEAYDVATELLTEIIRPDWQRHFKDMRKRRRDELTAAFEEKPVSEIFRLPLASRFDKMLGGAAEGAAVDAAAQRGRDVVPGPGQTGRLRRRHQGGPGDLAWPRTNGHRFEEAEPDSPVLSGCDTAVDAYTVASPRRLSMLSMGASAARRALSPTEHRRSSLQKNGSIESLVERREKKQRWREVWKEKEAKWKPLTACMWKCGALGTKNLLEATGYWCLGTLYGKYSAAWAYWAVQIIFVAINWLMMKFLMTKELLTEPLPGGVSVGDRVVYNRDRAESSGYQADEVADDLQDIVGVVSGHGKKRNSVKVNFAGRVMDLHPDAIEGAVQKDDSVQATMSFTEQVQSHGEQFKDDTRKTIKRWNWKKPWLVAFYPALGPAFCAAAASTPDPRLDQLCIPMCYFIHMSVNICISLLFLVDEEDGARETSRTRASSAHVKGTRDNVPTVDDESRRASQESTVAPACRQAAFVYNGLHSEDPLPDTPGDRDPLLNGEAFSSPGSEDESPRGERWLFASLQRCCSAGREPKRGDLEDSEDSGGPNDRKRSELQAMPGVLLRCGMNVLILLWFSALLWAIIGVSQGADLRLDLKNRQAFLYFSWGERVRFEDVLLNRPPSPYFLATSVVCPRDKVFVANKFTIYENVVADKNRTRQGQLKQVNCDINETILDLDAQCVGSTCTPILLLHGVRPTVWMCRNDGCAGTGWPLLQTTRADKFTTLLTEDAELEQAFSTKTTVNASKHETTLQVANASGFLVDDIIDIIEISEGLQKCVRETKTIREKKQLAGLQAELTFDTGLQHPFRQGSSVMKEALPPDQLVASVGPNVIEYRFDRKRRGYMPLWDVAPEAVTNNAGKLTALDFSKTNGQDRLVMFHTGGLVVSQDKETGTKCGEWTLPQGDSVVGGGCAYEDGWSVLALVKNDSGKMMLKHATLPESFECERIAPAGDDANATASSRCRGGGRLRAQGCPREK